jgi:hypothetical protein
MRYNVVAISSQPACVRYNAIWAQETRQHSLDTLNAASFCFTSLFIELSGKNDSLLSCLVFKLAAVPAANG